MTTKKVAITGAAGTIGTVLREKLKNAYQLTLLDLNPIKDADSIIIDVTEYSQLKEVLAGHDAIVHLARDNRGGFKSKDNWVPENDIMTWNIYKAAAEVGVKRVIMASSIHAVDFSNWNGPDLISPNELPNPDTPYGAMKASMETMGKYFAVKRGLEVICLRIGGVNSENVPIMAGEPDYHRIWLSHEDLMDLIRTCLDTENVPKNFQIVFGVSNNTGRIHDFNNALGWSPKDNAELKLKEVKNVLYQIVKKEGIPRKIMHIVWDVNGTITFGDIPDIEVCERILALTKKGVHHSFITGRDRRWLQKFIVFLGQFNGFEKATNNLHFYPELGLMNLNPLSGRVEITDLIKDHPILDVTIRQKIAGLFYQGQNLLPYQGEEKTGYFVGGDADGHFFLIPEAPAVELPHFVWSTSKEMMGTAEVIRNPNTSLRQDCAAKINESAERLAKIFRDWGIGNLIKVSPVSTALNLVPIVSGYALDKDVAAGIAISNLAQRLGMNANQVCSQTIAIGDGLADLQFATPIFGQIPICFVGPRSQLLPTKIQEEQVVLLGEGATEEGKAIGPKVTKEVLRLIEDKIPPKRDVIYLRGKDDLEKFEGVERLKRGIETRIRHFIPEEDVHVHDAFLDPSLQEGHIHSDGYEAIMLEEGEIDALVWTTNGQIQTYPLRDWGDMIVFLPGTQHTLLVKTRSRIIVAKAHMVAFSPDRRQKVELPAGMEAIREDMLSGRKTVETVLNEVASKL